MKLSERAQAAFDEYTALCHAMQTGVAYEMAHGSHATEPKHLRVGINTDMCNHAALVKLLVAKGVITDEEYFEAIRDEMREEVKRYKKRLSDHFGVEVTLG